jgi:hypothetical protein
VETIAGGGYGDRNGEAAPPRLRKTGENDKEFLLEAGEAVPSPGALSPVASYSHFSQL